MLEETDFDAVVPSAKQGSMLGMSARVQNILHREKASISQFASYTPRKRLNIIGFGEESESEFQSLLKRIHRDFGVKFNPEPDPNHRQDNESHESYRRRLGVAQKAKYKW